jgi:hypothetical protein
MRNAERLLALLTVCALAGVAISCLGGDEQGTDNEPATTLSLLPTPTPSPYVCGDEWSDQRKPGTVGYEIAANYGEIRNCGLFGDEWIITTLGKRDRQGVYTTSGVVAYYQCEGSDDRCVDGRTDHPLDGWTVVEPPIARGLTIMTWRPDKQELVLSGLTFSLITNTFVSPATPPR